MTINGIGYQPTINYDYIPADYNTLPPGDLPAATALEAAAGCYTCENRRYQDQSNDPGVSFQAPTKLSPNEAASAVVAHEREHAVREESKALEEGREVISNNIRIFTDVCSECGRVYVSGGETRTVTQQKEDNAPFAKDFFENTVGQHLTGRNIDLTA
jgi:hypothetical protein